MEWIDSKTILSGYSDNLSWFGSNYNMNIYKGCSHGCIYCDSRSECYHVEDFDRVRAKNDALAMLGQELKNKRRTGVIGTGAMSDPYNPLEKKYQLTRGALELINRYGYGIAIATKSDLIVRDIDLLKAISKHSPVIVKITVTTIDDTLCKKVEPHVAPSSKRLAAIKELSDNGIYVGALMMPVLPFIEDTVENVGGIIDKVHENGGKFIYPGLGVTLRLGQREWFYKQLDQLFPNLKQQYSQTYGNAYQCGSPNEKVLKQLIQTRCKEYGLQFRMKDIIAEYKRPYQVDQLTLF